MTVFGTMKINSYVTIKKMDKSSFIHHGTGIPIEIREYFELHDIVKGYYCERIPISSRLSLSR